MARKQVQSRIRTDLNRWLEDYAQEKDISKSAAIEDCIRQAKQLDSVGLTVKFPQEVWPWVAIGLLVTGLILGALVSSILF